MNPNPFSELARVAERGYAECEPLPGDPSMRPTDPFPGDCTRTDLLIRALTVRGRLTTVELAQATGLETKIVWGLLKNRKTAGQVAFDGVAWEMVPGWLPPEIKRAAELLRSRGWTCIAPGAKS